MKGKSFAFILFTFVFSALFIYGVYWLWQRQPKPQASNKDQTPNTQTVQTPTSQSQQNLTPEDFTVLKNPKVNFQGKTQANGYVLIYTDSVDAIITSDQNGSFQKEITLSIGFNLVSVSYISPDLKKTGQKILTLNISNSPNDNGNKVYAGSVKSIFDNLITLTTANGEKTVKITSNAQIDLPKVETGQNETASQDTGLNAIRVGDYMIALGNTQSTDTISSKVVQIIRDNKPQITKNLALAQFLTSVKSNVFQTKNLEDSKLTSFTVNKNTDIVLNGSEAKTTDIVKDKKAIIISTAGSQTNIASSIFIIQ